MEEVGEAEKCKIDGVNVGVDVAAYQLESRLAAATSSRLLLLLLLLPLLLLLLALLLLPILVGATMSTCGRLFR